MGVYREPREFWKLGDYMEAVQEAARPDESSPGDEGYENNVRTRIEKVKKAVADLEKFFETSNPA